jgi:hypothetical protein
MPGHRAQSTLCAQTLNTASTRKRQIRPVLLIVLLTGMSGATNAQGLTTTICERDAMRTQNTYNEDPYDDRKAYTCIRIEDDYKDGSTERHSRRRCEFSRVVYYSKEQRTWIQDESSMTKCDAINPLQPSPAVEPPKDWHPPLRIQ